MNSLRLSFHPGAPDLLTSQRVKGAPTFSFLAVCGGLTCLIPLLLSSYWVVFWISPSAGTAMLRLPVLGLSALVAFFWYRAPITHAEWNLVRVLFLVTVLLMIPALGSSQPGHAIGGIVKVLVVYLVCCFLARALRHPPSAVAFGYGLLGGAMILAGFTLFAWISYAGWTMPTYKTSREFKGVALAMELSLNSIAFSTTFGYLAALCLVPIRRSLLLLGIPLIAISVFFTGSRAPVAILVAAGAVMLCLAGLGSRNPLYRVLGFFGCVFGLLLLIATLVLTPDATLLTATEGRWHLWGVGWQKFLERPLLGHGYESWRDDLVSRLPLDFDLVYDLAKNTGGVYHNQYLTVLAEEGLVGGIAGALLIGFLFRSCWLLAFRRWFGMVNGKWMLFTCLFLLLRANFEVPGLMGYAQEPTDFISFAFLAIVVSRFSIEEDYAHTQLSQQTKGQPS